MSANPPPASDSPSPLSTDEVHPPVPDFRAWSWLPMVAILTTCGMIMAMHEADPDLWGHVQYGREILEAGTLPRLSTWTFTAQGYRWINHENLAELAMAAAVDAFGPTGLTWGKYLFSLLLIGALLAVARSRGVSLLVAGLMCLTCALAMEFHWHFRPQVFGYVLFTMMAALLSWSFARWPQILSGATGTDRRLFALAALIPLFAVWANTHGSFVAGLCLGTAYLGGRGVELMRARGVARSGTLCVLVGAAAGGALATLANPYGFHLHLWMLEALQVPRPEIGDWQSLGLLDGSRESMCFWIIVVTATASAWLQKRRDNVHVALLLITAWQALSHVRHLPLLAIVWASWFAVPLEQLRLQIVEAMRAARPRDVSIPARAGGAKPRWLMGGLACWTLGMAVLTLPKVTSLNVPRKNYPVDALAFMARHTLEGRTVVTFNWAQYAIGFFADSELESTVAIDGRFRTCYPQQVIDVYFDFFFGAEYQGPRFRSTESGPIDPARALRFKSPELVLISRQQQPTVREMQRHAQDWVLLYQDPLAQIWGRRDLYDDPASPRYLPLSSRIDANHALAGSVPWPAFAAPQTGTSLALRR